MRPSSAIDDSTDPVLVETLQQLLRGAEMVTTMTQRQIASSADASRRRITDMVSSGYSATAASLGALSTDLVEQLVMEVSANSEILAEIKSKAPPAVWRWAQLQYQSLKQSGLLEAAAKSALQALQGELEAASSFLPYLDAIDKVRREQQQKIAKQLKSTQQEDNKKGGRITKWIRGDG